MPELPEVETTVRGLNKYVKGLTIKDVWTDYPSHLHVGKNHIKNKAFSNRFKKEVTGEKIFSASRIGKNVLIHLSRHKTILVHMKMTGHFLYGKYEKTKSGWVTREKGPLEDPYNRFIHLVFILGNKKHLAFSDVRKFAKVTLLTEKDVAKDPEVSHIGPDPFSKNFTFEVFKRQITTRPNEKIKSALMDQRLIAGIGNIYSDEILWRAGVHPLRATGTIKDTELAAIYKNIRPILEEALKTGGDSASDYRDIEGRKGNYQNFHKAYRRTGKPCPKKDGGVIERIKIGGRSAHFCSKHQKLYK
ncbi:MAG: DNA-formamidopyrimidine glycosylase [bacterium]|nr:DNA-formamidopyrimidine glycosylase [bacterium]